MNVEICGILHKRVWRNHHVYKAGTWLTTHNHIPTEGCNHIDGNNSSSVFAISFVVVRMKDVNGERFMSPEEYFLSRGIAHASPAQGATVATKRSDIHIRKETETYGMRSAY